MNELFRDDGENSVSSMEMNGNIFLYKSLQLGFQQAIFYFQRFPKFLWMCCAHRDLARSCCCLGALRFYVLVGCIECCSPTPCCPIWGEKILGAFPKSAANPEPISPEKKRAACAGSLSDRSQDQIWLMRGTRIIQLWGPLSHCCEEQMECVNQFEKIPKWRSESAVSKKFQIIMECPRLLRLLQASSQKRSIVRNYWNPT